jgi:glycosyltransferase 2 family protein
MNEAGQPTKTPKKAIEAIKIVFFLSLGIGIVVWFWIQMNPEDKTQFLASVREAEYLWLGISILLGLFSHYIRALRWRLLLKVNGYQPSVPNAFFAVMNMYFFNLLVPRLGEITRCGMLNRFEKVPMDKGLGSVVAERAVDLIMLMLFMGTAVLVQLPYLDSMREALASTSSNASPDSSTSSSGLWRWIFLALFACAALLLYLLRKNPKISGLYLKIRNLAKGFWEGLKSVILVKEKKTFWLYTASIWILYFLMTWACFPALPNIGAAGPLPPLAIMAAGSIAIILVPGGVGAFPVIVAAVLALPHLGGVPQGQGLALGWIIWAAQTLLVLIAGSISLVLAPIYNQGRTKNQ